jgi:hypothetical protein
VTSRLVSSVSASVSFGGAYGRRRERVLRDFDAAEKRDDEL